MTPIGAPIPSGVIRFIGTVVDFAFAACGAKPAGSPASRNTCHLLRLDYLIPYFTVPVASSLLSLPDFGPATIVKRA
jgi:hypothetical protein